jgi:hypothetical protein
MILDAAGRPPNRWELDFIGPIPDFWPELYVRRQLEIRGRIRGYVGLCNTFTETCILVACPRWEREEVKAALEALVADGVLAVRGERYSLAEEVSV